MHFTPGQAGNKSTPQGTHSLLKGKLPAALGAVGVHNPREYKAQKAPGSRAQRPQSCLPGGQHNSAPCTCCPTLSHASMLANVHLLLGHKVAHACPTLASVRPQEVKPGQELKSQRGENSEPLGLAGSRNESPVPLAL